VFLPTVRQVLEQVRPYLISDGGNIRVVGVEPSSLSVLVELEGACGSCPSSTTTMKMGVERVSYALSHSLLLSIPLNSFIGWNAT
jgi:Fe-S cluster biogenesis protein NfuA